MSIIRGILRVLILIVDKLFKPKLALLPEDQQARLVEATKGMSLYQFEACPFCVKVRWAMRRMGVDIPLKDAKNNSVDILQGAPCLNYLHPPLGKFSNVERHLNCGKSIIMMHGIMRQNPDSLN